MLSAEVFTTLGLGDIYRVVPLRLIASSDCSTSFAFFIMQRFFDGPDTTDTLSYPTRPTAAALKDIVYVECPEPVHGVAVNERDRQRQNLGQ